MPDPHPGDLAERIAALATSRGARVGVAESLTGGSIAVNLAAADGASDWFCGGIVAYSPHVKFDVLGVPHGPIISEQCALGMARGAQKLLDADVVVATTGVGGPEPVEGQDVGTVWLATATRTTTASVRINFTGDPPTVVKKAVGAALQILLRTLESPEAAHAAEAIAI
ncbi:CinA family protein [Smaragdicoccus niigatensis]|uniref:CinA family protein n=1 Tax=Smaragdicoccus niigatensis TaxID=359359 RepID=UPI0003617820|nr:nicotinamide-nucleotide amidohydrolase family protein [Smaragdicoccus niigatensis]